MACRSPQDDFFGKLEVMSAWDPEGTRKRLAAVALDARQSMAAVSKGVWLWQSRKTDSSALKDAYDALLAKQSVYDSLAQSSCLESREKFIAEAAARRASGPESRALGAYDEGNYLRHWKLCMEALIAEYGAHGPGGGGAGK
jgi:hypothetical protein